MTQLNFRCGPNIAFYLKGRNARRSNQLISDRRRILLDYTLGRSYTGQVGENQGRDSGNFVNFRPMNYKLNRGIPSLLVIVALLAGLVEIGCSTDFVVNAPAKEIRAVYGILDPADTVQYIRISTAYQVEGDALQYAAERDLSLSGLNVRLTGDGKTWIAEEVNDVPKDSGIFIPNQFVYKFVTDGSDADHDTLKPLTRYQLEIGTPDTPDYITGATVTPEVPRIKGDLNLIASAGQMQCLPRLFLDRRLNFYWTRAEAATTNFEVRIYFTYEKDGNSQSLRWGPSELFNTNKRCTEGSANVCFQFAEYELLRFFSSSMPDDGSIYTYNTTDSCVANATLLDNLPQSLGFEVTAVDEYLSNYMTVNDPRFTDLTAARPEYTNLTGEIDVVGVFGSINKSIRYAIMRECGEALLGLNDRQLPAGCEWE